jgi:hypothetical protein
MGEKERGLNRRYQSTQKGRKEQRIPVALDVEIGGEKGGTMGRVIDLTLNGIQIRSPHNYGIGTRVALSLQIPKFAPGLDFVVEVKWIDPAGTTEEFLMGCKFVHTPESYNMLKGLVWEIASGNLTEIMRVPGQDTRKRDAKR